MKTAEPVVSTAMTALDFKRARILVVGDVMLDRYWFGDVSRISPEAPVPVVKVDRSEDRPGGAANVARNAAALGARVTLLSVVGKDEPGQRLRELLRAWRDAKASAWKAVVGWVVRGLLALLLLGLAVRFGSQDVLR